MKNKEEERVRNVTTHTVRPSIQRRIAIEQEAQQEVSKSRRATRSTASATRAADGGKAGAAEK